MQVFQVVEQQGLGVQESMFTYYPTDFCFFKKEDADKKADELWKQNTTEVDRKSGWCAIHYIVKPLNVV